MTKTIITGVDGSETAAQAARTAAEMAAALGADLVVISAYGKLEVERVASGSEEFFFSTAEDAKRVAASVIAAQQADFPDVTMTARAAKGRPADALVKAAERLDAALIVVGNKRVQGIARVLGSIARDVAAHAPCDVYIAHTHK